MQIDRYAEALALLADGPAQDRYEAEVPLANVPAELVSMWFDDLDPCHLDAELTEEEIAAIQDFTAFFESRLARLPMDGEMRALRGTAEWFEIGIEARKALQRVVRDAAA